MQGHFNRHPKSIISRTGFVIIIYSPLGGEGREAAQLNFELMSIRSCEVYSLRSILPPKNPTQVSEDQSQGQFAQHPNIHSWGHMETQPLSEESPTVMVPAETMRLGPQMCSLTKNV